MTFRQEVFWIVVMNVCMGLFFWIESGIPGKGFFIGFVFFLIMIISLVLSRWSKGESLSLRKED